ncbi:hypothetical protein [Nostoc sp. 'Peltigera membranacea cyanobiont' 232]|uniref:hypothetical protein n=1 Tax=Nostoc sp. 'Peltigera membranacea cyanobiont' 232 TaxID=2014531 RepID=UPI001CB9B0F7|nr:hypothetical protein [Nostoc sp. 'Peltigera membranacea cyanobiont' 232]
MKVLDGTSESPGCNSCDRRMNVESALCSWSTALLRSPPPHGWYAIAVPGRDSGIRCK